METKSYADCLANPELFENSSGASLSPEEVRRCPSGLSQSPPLSISSSGSSSLLPQKTKKSPAVLCAGENFLARLEGKPSIPAACAVSLDLFTYLF